MIIGGGIGGLVLAHLLRQDPAIRVRVHERDKSPGGREQGYYIGLQSSGLKIVKERLAALVPGLSELISDPGACLEGFKVTDGFLHELLSIGSEIGTEAQSRLVSRWGLR